MDINLDPELDDDDEIAPGDPRLTEQIAHLRDRIATAKGKQLEALRGELATLEAEQREIQVHWHSDGWSGAPI